MPFKKSVIPALLVWMVLSSPALALQSGDFTYAETDGGFSITGYTGPGGDVEIPEEIDGTPVVGIGASAFYNNDNITGISLPSSVTTIETAAFSHCTGLTTINIPENVTCIWERTFNGCTGLTSMTIPSTIGSIGDLAFYGCTSLIAAIFDGDAPTLYDSNVFASCAGEFTVYYLAGAAGFTNPWYGYPAVEITTSSTSTTTSLPYEYYEPYCENWLGNWVFVYESGPDNITITQVCKKEEACLGSNLPAFFWCQASGSRDSDGQSILIAQMSLFSGRFNYFELAVEELNVFAPAPSDIIPLGSIDLDNGTFDNVTSTEFHLLSGWKRDYTTSVPTTTTSVISTTTTTAEPTTTTSVNPYEGTVAYCDNWLGEWVFTYESGPDNVTITQVCKKNESCLEGSNPELFWCQASGTRQSDGQSILIAQIAINPHRYFYYELELEEFNVLTPTPFDGIPLSGINLDCGSFDNVTEGNSADDFHLLSGQKQGSFPDCGAPETCALTLMPARINRLVSLIKPLAGFLLRGGDDAAFSKATKVDWGTEAVQTLLKIPLGPRTIFAVAMVWAGQLDPGATYEVSAGGCAGELTVRPL